MIVRLTLPDQETVREYAFHRADAVIGRGRRCDLHLPALPDVALRHARLKREGQRIWIEPLRPNAALVIERSGVGRIKSSSPIALVPGDIVLLGTAPDQVRLELVTADFEAETGPEERTLFHLHDPAPDASAALLGAVTRFAVDAAALGDHAELCRALGRLVEALTGRADAEVGLILFGIAGQDPRQLLPERLETLLGGHGALVTSTRWRSRTAANLAKGAVLEVRGRDDEHVVLVPLATRDCFLGLWTFGAPACMDLDALPAVARPVTDLVESALDRLTQARDLEAARQETRYFRERERRHYLFKELVTESASMQAVYEKVRRMVREATTVWILGEKGTGKEMIARALHHLSDRSASLMISHGCGVADEAELDIELFGSAELDAGGDRRPGLLELTRGGTLFLEEVDRLPLSLQAKLNRAIQEREVRPRGGAIARPVDVCLVVSTERDLFPLVEAGQFRKDLYLRLAQQTLHLPPLRERLEDIVPLADVFVQNLAPRYRKAARRVDPALVETLHGYHWPGNVRELQGYIEAAVIAADPEDESIRMIPGLPRE